MSAPRARIYSGALQAAGKRCESQRDALSYMYKKAPRWISHLGAFNCTIIAG